MSALRSVHYINVGRMSFQGGLNLQTNLVSILKSRVSPNGDTNAKPDGFLVLVEHNPVYTVGIRGQEYDLVYEQKLRTLGADFIRTNRGGLVTFHGPGQLVVYPILNLKAFKLTVKSYVSQLEKVVIKTCFDFGISARTSPHTGVWVNDRKICALGIRVSQHVSSHGLALNCTTDMKWFDHIVPCGIEGKGVTSISEERGHPVHLIETVPKLLCNFEKVFSCSVTACEDLLLS